MPQATAVAPIVDSRVDDRIWDGYWWLIFALSYFITTVLSFVIWDHIHHHATVYHLATPSISYFFLGAGLGGSLFYALATLIFETGKRRSQAKMTARRERAKQAHPSYGP